MKIIVILICSLLLCSCHQHATTLPEIGAVEKTELASTPSAVVANSTPEEWRELDAENTLYLTLETGLVIVEMIPEMAPAHVENTKALVRQGIFDGSSFYRVIDAFVAQGGPMYATEEDMPDLQGGSFSIAAEFTTKEDLGDAYRSFDGLDGYADETGFLKSYAVGKDLSTDESWLLHCYGAFGMGRTNDFNTGGTELYIVNGPAQRYLDRNATVFGRVVAGMAHVQALQRGDDLNGPIDLTGKNLIKRIQVAADLPAKDRMAIEVLDSSSESFGRLLEARKNRTGEWFVHQHDYMDACGVPIPIRIKAANTEG